MRPVEDEGPSRRRDLELATDRNLGVQVAAGDAVVFALDGDSVVVATRSCRERIVAEYRPLPCAGMKSKREVLAGARRGKRFAARIREPYGDHRIGFSLDSGHLQS